MTLEFESKRLLRNGVYVHALRIRIKGGTRKIAELLSNIRAYRAEQRRGLFNDAEMDSHRLHIINSHTP